ncbi:ferredoxin [Thiovibrio frasassiensis]|jgi:ferredoxin|uniref:Ferredoxin n=1 Tax=Thiovibrio frasassiensis TaxID=2984131 RepID=A0A9X4MGX3_9BACT|nr:ferredoxin [Thiovibrio frasassiensis]MDG4474619.1 ferredoxin [Thiovibrio frasassiensis]
MNCRVNIDTYRCNSCETCVVICPEVFRMNTVLEKAESISDTVECSELLERAVAMCPEKCIEIEQE